MTRAQAFTIAILTGLVVLVCLGLFALITLPFERFFPPAPTPTPITPTPTPTPTLPKLLPTASLATITPEPTATSTRVPTATPRPPRSPTPTVIINLTLPPRKPTPTQTSTLLPFPTPTPSATISPIPPPRGYSIKFEAKETRLEEDECTDLRWTVEGASSVRLDGDSVAASDKKKICPKRDTKYTLTVRLPDSTQLKRTVKVSVEEEEK